MDNQLKIAVRYVAAVKDLDSADQERLKSQWGGGHIDLSGMDKPLSEASPADIIEYVFGDGLETPHRARFILASTDVARVLDAGWSGPRTEADNGIDSLTTTLDFHTWCIDKENGDKVMDYPDHQLAPKCTYKTDRVIRQVWQNDLVEGIRPRFEIESPIYIQHLINEKGSAEDLLTAMENNNFPLNHCLARAYFLHSTNPSRYEVVIGAFGFVQSDGRTFWECG